MRRSKEIVFLFGLLVAAMAFVLGYVIHRRAQNRATAATATTAARPTVPEPAMKGPLRDLPREVPLGGENERKTVDFSSGQPVVKNTPEDQAVIDAAVKEMHQATKDVTFQPPAPKP